MRVFKDLEMVEQLGSGIPRILKSYSKDVFTFSNSFIRMTFPFETLLHKNNNEKSSEKILKFINEDKYISARELAKLLNISPRAVEKQIKTLKQKGKLKRTGANKGGYWEVVNI